jgi:hypothetical protein
MTIKEGKKNKVRLGFKVASLYKQLPWTWYGFIDHACVPTWASPMKGDSLENKFKDCERDGNIEHRRGKEEE